VPAVGEADVMVVDTLVGRPERLTLLKRHVVPIALPRGRGRHVDGRLLPHVILQPGRGRQLAQERRRWVIRCSWASRRQWRGRRPAAPARATARRCLVVILHLLQPGRHLHGAGAGSGSVGGGCGWV
jgi:hypothetical protein